MTGSPFAGPPPKRSEERRRRNKTTEGGANAEPQKVIVDPAVMDDTSMVPAPGPNPEWHWLAKMLYDSAKRSAVREFYEPTDWAQLFFLCEQISIHMSAQPVVVQSGPNAGEVVHVVLPMPGGVLASILKGFQSMMFAEADRRRLRIEVERQAGSAAARQEAPTAENVVKLRQRRLTS